MKLIWMEPRAYWLRRQGPPGMNLKSQTLYGLALFAAALLLRFASSQQPAQRGNPVNWPMFAALAFAVSLALAYAWPPLSRKLTASNVIISEKGVNNNIQSGSATRINFWAWSSLGKISVGDDNGQRVLVLTDGEGRRLEAIAIAPAITNDQIRRAVEDFGGTWDDASVVV